VSESGSVACAIHGDAAGAAIHGRLLLTVVSQEVVAVVGSLVQWDVVGVVAMYYHV